MRTAGVHVQCCCGCNSSTSSSVSQTWSMPSYTQLIGGVERQEPGGAHIRGEVHMLLVGDPGTGERRQCCGLVGWQDWPPHAAGLLLQAAANSRDSRGSRCRAAHLSSLPSAGKSQFQKYVAKLAPRAVVTSGRASSAVSRLLPRLWLQPHQLYHLDMLDAVALAVNQPGRGLSR